MTNQLTDLISTFYISAYRLVFEKYTYKASALAFTTLLGLVPLLSIIVYMITIFPIFTDFVNLAQNYIVSNFMPTGEVNVQQYLENFIRQATHLPFMGILFLFITTVLLITTIEETLDEIWNVKERPRQFTDLIIYWAILYATPIFIGVSIFISTYLFSISWIAGATRSLGLNFSLTFLPFVINAGMFTALYTLMPRTAVTWSDGLLGGIVASFLFELGKKIFALYVKHFPSYELIYGTLAAIPIFLVWLYISWLIILYGALVTNTRYKKRVYK